MPSPAQKALPRDLLEHQGESRVITVARLDRAAATDGSNPRAGRFVVEVAADLGRTLVKSLEEFRLNARLKLELML